MEEDSEKEQEKGHAMGANMEVRHMADRPSRDWKKALEKE